MYVVCKNQYQRIEALRLVVNSRGLPVTDLMTDRRGNVLEIVPVKLGSVSWRSMSGSLQMLLGKWVVTATPGLRAQRPIAGQWSSDWHWQ